jgi:hypothetical protein
MEQRPKMFAEVRASQVSEFKVMSSSLSSDYCPSVVNKGFFTLCT